ncbi:PKD domain-containing protein [Longitalea arenae]|uniref:PKD domain-containing protein n=1 Tax=Longitalea arenae TaxID=2812558 RepID=UPI00196818F6|nr:T9SS type A sorting domain-containing protein [Longitalea arenae]
MKKTILLRATVFLFFAITFIQTMYAQNVRKFMFDKNGDTLHFLEYRPSGHSIAGNTHKYPMIIFLHGIGERSNNGADLFDIDNFGPARQVAIGNIMKYTWAGVTDTFIVLSPMSRTSRPGDASIGHWYTDYVDSIIAYAKRTLKVDTNRIYLTGLSMGGGGTQHYLSMAPGNAKKLAAAAPICSPSHYAIPGYAPSGQFESYVRAANLPYWAFHAKDDSIAPYRSDEAAVERINGVHPSNPLPPPAVKALMTLWQTGGHNVWGRVYDSSLATGGYEGIVNIYEWFLGQNKSLAVNVLPLANAGSDYSIHANPGMTRLTGAASTDADGSIVRYVWKVVSKPAGANISFTSAFGPSSQTDVTGLTVTGQYKFELNVVDNRASIDKDTIIITVVAGTNTPPVASAGTDKVITLPTNAVQVSSSASTDTDGFIAGRLWSFIDGPGTYTISNQFVTSPTISNLVAGVYRFQVQVRDNELTYDWDTVTITVNSSAFAVRLSDETVANDNSKLKTLTISSYPNPAQKLVNLRLSGKETGQLTIRVYDVNGALIRNESSNKQGALFQKSVNVAGLKTGLYYVEIKLNGKRYTTTFIKE